MERWLTELLPFTPTGDQQRAIARVTDDLAQPHPMQRLLMGEVGSGKTVVALAAMLRAVEHGHQAALMAPTETLAEQHFATLQALMPGEAVPAALLTGSTTAARRADMLGKLASGELSLVVGTHALIEDDVRFDRLAVAVVDEQHRFGVRQRAALDAKAAGEGPTLAPHVLHMTATPIPRTLAPARLRRSRRDRAARAAARAPADRHARRRRRARALAGLRAHARGAARGTPGVRRLPAGRGVRGAAGARRDRGVRAPGDERARRLPRRAAARPDAPGREVGGDARRSRPARRTCSSRRR